MPNPTARTTTKLGICTMVLERYGLANAPHRLVHVHASERSTLKAALKLQAQRDLVVYSLSNGTRRYVRFQLKKGGREWKFDPNRMFSEAGVKKTLQKRSRRKPSSNAIAAVCGFADWFRAEADLKKTASRPTIALHTNYDGGYGVDEYLPGGEHARAAAQVNRVSAEDADEFFFTTEVCAHAAFAHRARNSVLQRPNLRDDGSLSVWAAGHGLPYINVEGQRRRGALPLVEAALDVADLCWP
jgi:hypothetical protein